MSQIQLKHTVSVQYISVSADFISTKEKLKDKLKISYFYIASSLYQTKFYTSEEHRIADIIKVIKFIFFAQIS